MLRIGARAKINWTLDITGRRADGYHLMDMLMQSVTLADEITLEKTTDGIITLTTGGTPLLPADEHHLALRAARALQKATSCPLGARIHVEKHIPVGAGMGGGSSDAAAVLRALRTLYAPDISDGRLETLAARQKKLHWNPHQFLSLFKHQRIKIFANPCGHLFVHLENVRIFLLL